MLPLAARTRLAGVSGLGGSANARRAASAFSAPPSAKTITRALVSAGIERVTRSTNGSSPGSAGRTRLRPCSVGAFGNSDATWPSGPMPSSARSNTRVAELALVVGCRALLAELALDPVNVTRRRAEVVEQRAFRERVVRQLVVWRHAALVAPPELDIAPVGLALRRLLVREPRCPAACERDVSAAPCSLCKPVGDRGCDSLGVVDDDELQVGHKSPAANSLDRSIAA